MDGIGAAALCHADDFIHIQIRLQRVIVFADLVSFIRLVAVQRIAVFKSVNGNSWDAQFGGSTGNTDGNFATVSDKEFIDLHGAR